MVPRRLIARHHFLLLVIVTLATSTPTLLTALGHPHTLGIDFLDFYTAAHQLVHGTLYDHPAFFKLAATYAPIPSAARPFIYYPQPPQTAVLTLPFAALPEPTAFAAYTAVAVAATLAATLLLLRAWPPIPRLLAALLILFSNPSLASLQAGSDAWIVLLALAGLYYARSTGAPTITAASLCLATVKPQDALWLALITYLDTPRSHRRTLITRSALLLLPWTLAPLLIRPDARLYPRFLFTLVTYHHQAESTQPNLRGICEGILSLQLALAASLLILLPAVALIRTALLRHPNHTWRANWLIALCLALLATPFSHITDLTLLLPPYLLTLYPRGDTSARSSDLNTVTLWLLFPYYGSVIATAQHASPTALNLALAVYPLLLLLNTLPLPSRPDDQPAASIQLPDP